MRVVRQNFASTHNLSSATQLREMKDYLLNSQSLMSNYLMAPSTEINNEVMRHFPPKFSRTNKIYLRGPFSPMETNLLPANKISFWKTVLTERDSVNSLVLNTDPQDTHERLLVAAKITESSGGHGILARQSTLMPNIPGFGPLVAMLFCPKMQVKCNANRSKYIGVLTGLGYDPKTNESLFPEHDLFFHFDVEFDINDFQLVRKERPHIYYLTIILLYLLF